MKTQPARGMRDFLPSDVRRRNYVINIIREVYERYGFEPLETPAVENIETLTGKYGEEGNQLIFKILKRGEHAASGQADLALRYDLTVPLARVVAEYKNDLPKFFKRYQIQPVWRADRPARGRFREFYQCDVDVIGSRSMIVEAELISAVSDVLIKLGFDDFIIRVNHRKFLTAILLAAGISQENHTNALVAIDKLDKIGIEGVAKELVNRNCYGDKVETLLKVLEYLKDRIWNAEKIAGVITTITTEFDMERLAYQQCPDLRGGVNELDDISRFLGLLPANKYIRFDPSLARGLSYYTGTIMEIAVRDLTGSLGGGGRYDGLIGMFGKEEIPACGFSLGLERIIIVMSERNMFQASLLSQISSPADVMISIYTPLMEDAQYGYYGFITDSLKLANQLRQSNLRVDVYAEADKLGKQFKYAAARNIPFVCVIGDERTNDTVRVKNMQTGAQESVARADVAAFIKTQLARE